MGRRKLQILINLTNIGLAIGTDGQSIFIHLLFISFQYSWIGTGCNIQIEGMGRTLYDSQKYPF